MPLLTLALLAVIIAAGAGLQRLTGMGFALVATPFLVLTVGPLEGVLVTNLCGIVSALLNLALVHREVQWRRLLRFTPFSLPGIVVGVLVLQVLPAEPLAVLVGVLILLAIAVSVLVRPGEISDGLPLSAGFGAASGFMNATAGVGGPALAVYAVATGWSHRGFAASAQAHFALLCALSLAAKGALPSMPGAGWVVTVVAILAGVAIGERLAGRFAEHALMRLVIVLSALGAVMTIVQALV
ncbi:TSUP family transporter [Brachybacterium sacelli]|uniref:Probable membrane transporter protein n=1 Tax=Brachybacterium sacelli TaxID=173364 RepID=A0ABS4WYJ3_9MICO|nr:putative membrane protein YfcA [Brachybacterium sacelli]